MSNFEIEYPNLYNGKIASQITNNKRSIQSFIMRQDTILENAIRRRRKNIITKINEMQIYTADDFPLDTWSYDVDSYNDIVDLFKKLEKKHSILELENVKLNELISNLLIEINQKVIFEK
jgi:hypothetical protein